MRSLATFRESMDTLIREMKDAPKATGQDRIYIHGEKEFERAERSAVEGVPVMDATVKSLSAIGAEIRVPFDLDPIHRRGA